MYGLVTCLLWEGVNWPRMISVYTFWYDFTVYNWHSENQKERMGDLEYWPRRIPCIFWVMFMWRVYMFYLPAAEISSGTQLSSLCPNSLLLQASITKKLWPKASLLLLRWARCQPLRVNPMVYSLCGEQSSSMADELEVEPTHLLTESLGTHERMGYASCKDDLMAYSLWIIMLFAIGLAVTHQVAMF